MDHSNKDDDASEDEQVRKLIASIYKIEAIDSNRLSLDEAVNRLRLEILDAPMSTFEERRPTISQFAAPVYKLLGKSERVEACVDWLRKTGQFTKQELDLIRRIKLFREEKSGCIFVPQELVSLAKATILISALSFLAAIWIGWILFTDHAGLQQIACSFSFGTIVGTLVGYLLDRSFRFERIRNKVLSISPRFFSALR